MVRKYEGGGNGAVGCVAGVVQTIANIAPVTLKSCKKEALRQQGFL